MGMGMRRKTAFIGILALVFAGGLGLAKQPESYYQEKWCALHGMTFCFSDLLVVLVEPQEW